jgi:hypothetical protein
MSVEYLTSICNDVQPKELAYQIGLAVYKGLSEDAVWVALEPILDHRIMANVISRMASVNRRDAEEEAELALAAHPLLDLSPRLQILVLRALLRKHRYDDDKTPITAFVDRLRAFWNDDPRVQRMCEIADLLVDNPFGRGGAEWEDLLESTPPVECHQPYLDQAQAWSFSAPTWTDDEIYGFIRSSTAHCRKCEEIALATVEEERMDLIAERIWQAQLADEMVEVQHRGY